MGIPVLIIGKSGSGKSRSIKNFKKGEGMVIQCVNKLLPFKTNIGKSFTTDYNKIYGWLSHPNCPNSVFIDDAGYLLTDEFMRRSGEVGYDKFTDMGKKFYSLIDFINNVLPPTKIVYIIMHEEESEITGLVKPKTIGKLLDEKVCVEGMFTIVLRCVNEIGNHQFYVNNSGCAKTPEDMFPSDIIENDLTIVDKTIREYYGLTNETNTIEEKKEEVK